MKNNSALFYTCSLIEFIGRERKLKRSELVSFLGSKVIERIYRYADVFHCEPIEKIMRYTPLKKSEIEKLRFQLQ